TVSATTWALAPGKLAVTRTVGGVMSGYSATGKKPAAMAPSRMITTEITHARIGRSMKKRASTASLLSGFFRPPRVCREWDRHVHELRLDRDARSHLLQAVDDHLLARLQAVGDLPQAVVERSESNGTGDHFAVLVHDVDDRLPLVG